MDKNELKVKLEKEQFEIEALKEKRAKLDKQIREKSEKAAKYERQISEIEMEEFQKNLAENGMTFEDLKKAISKGDLSDIQQKLRKTEE